MLTHISWRGHLSGRVFVLVCVSASASLPVRVSLHLRISMSSCLHICLSAFLHVSVCVSVSAWLFVCVCVSMATFRTFAGMSNAMAATMKIELAKHSSAEDRLTEASGMQACVGVQPIEVTGKCTMSRDTGKVLRLGDIHPLNILIRLGRTPRFLNLLGSNP